MDILLGKVTQQAMNYAIRSGVTITTGYAIKQCGRLLKEAPRGKEREELARLQIRLEGKIRIISPAIDMIELIAARGNTSLESAVTLTKEIRYDIQNLGVRLNKAANDEELLRRASSRAKTRQENEQQLKDIISDIRTLLLRIEDAVPLINLAITTSGINLSTKLSGSISPSRLLQASTFLTSADSKFTTSHTNCEQVGPTYIVSMYMLFAGHAWRPVDEAGVREATWKEVIHKARLKLMRVPLDHLYDLPGELSEGTAQPSFRESTTAAEFAYQLLIVEDLDDDRVHTFEAEEKQPGPFDDVANAGIRDAVPIHEVSKIFYADTGKILNIGGDGETNNPVLLLKRDVHAEPPRRMMQGSRSMDRNFYDNVDVDGEELSEVDAQIERESTPGTPMKEQETQDHFASNAWRLPADLDPEWMAFEVYAEESDSDSDSENTPEPEQLRSSSKARESDPSLASYLSMLSLRSRSATPSSNAGQLVPTQQSGIHLSPNKRPQPTIKTSLSLLEMLIKLAALQQFRQESHLAIEDELLNFFLEDSATAGAGADKSHRRRMRYDAVKRVGFDPYDESPIKRHTESYIQRGGAGSPRSQFEPVDFNTNLPYDEDYEYGENVRQSTEGPSSPSPRPPLLRQTPSRSSTPASSRAATPVGEVRRGSAPPSAGDRPLATPPGTARSRQSFLRAQGDAMPKSPLGQEVTGEENSASDKKH